MAGAAGAELFQGMQPGRGPALGQLEQGPTASLPAWPFRGAEPGRTEPWWPRLPAPGSPVTGTMWQVSPAARGESALPLSSPYSLA